jgi:TfoX N-terminal domain
MEIPKPSDADKQFFLSLLPDDPAVEVKPMFGNLGAFVNGNMFAGLFGPAVGVRLDDQAQAELAAIDGSGPFGARRAPDGRLHQPARGLAGHARPRGGLGGAGPDVRRLAAPEAEETETGQEIGPGQGYCAAGSPLTVSSTRSG